MLRGRGWRIVLGRRMVGRERGRGEKGVKWMLMLIMMWKMMVRETRRRTIRGRIK
jgi:hypothetical protein